GLRQDCPGPLVTDNILTEKIKEGVHKEVDKTYCDRKCPSECSCLSTDFTFKTSFSGHRITFLKNTGLPVVGWVQAAATDPARSCQLDFDLTFDIVTTVTLGVCLQLPL